MRTEKGVVILTFKRSGRTPRFLVLNRKKNWEGWELPKGHLEENYLQTAYQELKEEAGIDRDDVEEIYETEYETTWEYEDDGEKIRREYRVMVARVSEDSLVDVSGNPHNEHEKGHFLRKRDVNVLLTHQNQIELLEKAGEEITLP